MIILILTLVSYNIACGLYIHQTSFSDKNIERDVKLKLSYRSMTATTIFDYH